MGDFIAAGLRLVVRLGLMEPPADASSDMIKAWWAAAPAKAAARAGPLHPCVLKTCSCAGVCYVNLQGCCLLVTVWVEKTDAAAETDAAAKTMAEAAMRCCPDVSLLYSGAGEGAGTRTPATVLKSVLVPDLGAGVLGQKWQIIFRTSTLTMGRMLAQVRVEVPGGNVVHTAPFEVRSKPSEWVLLQRSVAMAASPVGQYEVNLLLATAAAKARGARSVRDQFDPTWSPIQVLGVLGKPVYKFTEQAVFVQFKTRGTANAFRHFVALSRTAYTTLPVAALTRLRNTDTAMETDVRIPVQAMLTYEQVVTRVVTPVVLPVVTPVVTPVVLPVVLPRRQANSKETVTSPLVGPSPMPSRKRARDDHDDEVADLGAEGVEIDFDWDWDAVSWPAK